MTDNQAGWVVVERSTFDAMRARIECEDWQGTCGDCSRSRRCSCRKEHDDLMALIDAPPRYEPGDAVEAAYQAWDRCTSPSKLVAMRAALTAAFPELLARIEALEQESARIKSVMLGKYDAVKEENDKLQAEVDRLRKGVV